MITSRRKISWVGGVARLTRLPVTEKIEGSNPFRPAIKTTLFSKDHKYTVEQLKKARIEADLDQADVAKMLGRTQPHVSKIEAGQRRLDVTQLKEFAKIYKKDLSFFIK